MTLYQLIGGFVIRHWRNYVASALMLIGIAVLTVWVPRVVGQAVDGLVAGTLQRQRPVAPAGHAGGNGYCNLFPARGLATATVCGRVSAGC